MPVLLGRAVLLYVPAPSGFPVEEQAPLGYKNLSLRSPE
jgi:hypothetical protein